MAKSKKDIRNFCLKYIDLRNDGKSVESISSFISIDSNRVKMDRDNILKFFAENFPIITHNVKYIDLARDENDETWNEVESLADINLIEYLVAIGIEVGLFEDDMRVRMFLSQIFDNVKEYIDSSELDFSEPEVEQGYIKVFKERILPEGFIKCNREILNPFKDEVKNEFSDKEIKELIWFWWNSFGSFGSSEEVIDRLQNLMDSNLNGLLDFIVHLTIKDESPVVLHLLLDLVPQRINLDDTNALLNAYSTVSPENFNIIKEELLLTLRRDKRVAEKKKLKK